MELTYLTYLEILSGILELIIGIGSIVIGSNLQSFLSSFMSILPTKYVTTPPGYLNYVGLLSAGFGIAFIVLAISSFFWAWVIMKDMKPS